MPLDSDLLAILACPACLGTFTEPADAAELTCAGCQRTYPVRDGIPVLLTDEARLPASPTGRAD